MEEQKPVFQSSAEPDPPKNRSIGWLTFWTIMFMLIGFGIIGLYLDQKLESLEQKVMKQTGEVSKQNLTTLQVLKTTQKEILGNRQETAAFAEKFTNTLDDMSSLLTKTVNVFSDQTLQLTKAIEQKEKNQSESIQTAMSDLTQKMEDTHQIAMEAKVNSDSMDQRMVKLSGQLKEINKDLSEGFLTLTQVTQKMSEAVTTQLEKQAQSLDGQLVELRQASQNSLEDIQGKLIAIDQEILDSQNTTKSIAQNQLAAIQKKVDRFDARLQEETNTVHDSLARHIDTVVDTVNDGFRQQKQMTGALHQQIASPKPMDQHWSKITDMMTRVSEEMEIGFASVEEGREAIQSDLADMSYQLNGRTEDLLIELAGLKKSPSHPLTVDSLASVETRLDSLSKTLQGMRSEMESQLAEVVSTVSSQQAPKSSTASEEKLQQAIQYIQKLGDQVRSLHEGIQNKIDATRTKAAAWMDDPESKEARSQFEAELQIFTQLIQSTQVQMEDLQKQISGLATKLTQGPAPEQTDTSNKPIGMLPSSGEAIPQ